MKLGYPCVNLGLEKKSNKTFRLKNFTAEKFLMTVEYNLNGLLDVLTFNLKHNFLFFRISSNLIPFASHLICDIDWQNYFKDQFKMIGKFILKNKIRISMHPSQFVVINALNDEVVKNSISELRWHAELLDLMELKNDAKVQVHVGGIYGDKHVSIQRFINNYRILPESIRRRLVIENDDHLYSLQDCLEIHDKISIPIVFDNFHHECLNNQESIKNAVQLANSTWRREDGVLMVDYSSQALGERIGKHTHHIDKINFQHFINETRPIEFDIMLEIKDKEKSAFIAQKILSEF